MSQQRSKLTWYPVWLDYALVVETACSDQVPKEVGGFKITAVERRALAFLRDFGKHLPERGSVTIRWEKERTSSTATPESS